MPKKLKELTSMCSNMILREDLIYRKTDYDLLAHEFDVQLPVTHSQILMMRKGGGGGGSNRGSYFIPKKITTSKFFYPKKSLLF